MANGGGDEAKAYDYINALLDPSATQPLMDAGFGHANQAAFEDQITPDEQEAGGLGPIDVPVLAQLPMRGDLRQKQGETFERIKAGF